MILVRVGHLVARRWLVVTRVEEALVVVRPGDVRELHPLDDVGEILASVDIAHMQFLPVGTARRQTVSEIPTVVRYRGSRQCYGTICGEQIRIEQHSRRLVSVVLDVKHVLVLQSAVLEIEVASVLLERRGKTLVVPECRQPVADRLALRDRRQKGVGQPVLRCDPFLRRR